MAKENENKQVAQEQEEIKDFPIDIQKNIVDIINDTPSLIRLGDKEYKVKGMRYYSLYRICNLVLDMRKADETLDTDQKVITALCTDLDAMCEIMAVVLCNHLFTPDGNNLTWEEVRTKNDYYVSVMKAKVMQSTFDANQWAAIVLGAIKSIDLSAFFLLKKSVKIGEYAYGFTSDSEEEIGGDSITIYGSTIIADAADFLRAFPQYRLDDYLYRLSIAQVQFMAVDNTHTKYLRGTDKKAWQNFKEAYEAQKKLERFFNSMRISEIINALSQFCFN